jgi:hypothetical protein
MSAAQSGDELPAKDFGESPDGQQERVFRVDPAVLLWSDSASRNHTVNMRVKEHILPPGVKNAEETNLGPEVFGIARHLAKGFSHSAKEQL